MTTSSSAQAAIGSDSTVFYTVAECAAILACSPRTIQRLVKPSKGKDRLLAVQIGGVVRVRKTVFEAYLRAREGRAA